MKFNRIDELENNFDKKIDKLINSIDSYTKNIKKSLCGYSDNNSTSWTDLLLFIALGILAIVVLDLFFKFGKTVKKLGGNFINQCKIINFLRF